MFPTYFQRMAAYNAWANRLVYLAVAEMPDADYRKDAGAFFGSVHRTLNHLVVTDRIWLRRMTGTGENHADLDAVPYAEFDDLKGARKAEDRRIVDWVGGLTDSDFATDFTYRNMAGDPFTDRLDLLLGHFFNHQTHHRGQVHTIMSVLGHMPPSLDLIYFSRVG
ncbi:DinB family protein [Minwuia sp.]|uniref:DinB family protein n=1 Tax=Minwuia sp. TaxID=2493630 RepID=UPI003A902106